jgi:ketosteroid isomerase-like protein
MKLPPIIEKYVDASNRHDVQSILSCFSDEAVVHDEAQTLNGKTGIKGWVTKTIEKYKFQFKPRDVKNGDGKSVIVVMEVSGTFDGSPVTLDYAFVIESDRIRSLTIE